MGYTRNFTFPYKPSQWCKMQFHFFIHGYLVNVDLFGSYDCAIIYSSSPAPLPFALANLLAGKCNLAIRGRGARDFWSNPRTQTYPAICH